MENHFKIKDFIRSFKKGDLKARYIVALAMLAFLLISLQFMVQLNLQSQKDGLETIQIARSHIDELNDLKRELYLIQTEANSKSAKFKFDEAIKNLEQLNKQEAIIWGGDQSKGIQDSFSKRSNKLGDQLSEIRSEISNSIEDNEQNDTKKISQSVFGLTGLIENYISFSDKQLDIFDDELADKLDRFRFFELSILIIILTVLVLEALFIFFPALDKLEKALKARSDFFSRIGHEIRNPMNSILGMTELLQKQKLNKVELMYLSRLQQSAEGLLSFLNNVIEFSGIEKSKQKNSYSKINIKELIEELTAISFLDASRKSLAFYVFVDGNIPVIIESDFIKLKHILMNLIGNAIKFTPAGFISLTLKFNQENKLLTFIIADTGIGVSKERQKEIFYEFIQEDSSTKRKFGGTGLGLTIVQEYVDQLNGTISLESEKNQGSKFTLSIPLKSISRNNFEIFTKSKYIVLENMPLLRSWIEFHKKDNQVILDLEEFNERRNELELQDVSYFVDSQKSASNLNCGNLKNVFICNLPASAIETTRNHHYLFPFIPWHTINTENVKIDDKKINSNLSRKKVLICDDSYDNRLILKDHLNNYFREIHTVENGRDCLNSLESNFFPFIFLDIQMPEMDGLSVIEQAKKLSNCKNSIFIAFTAHNSAIEKEQMFKAGFNYLLEKPIRKNVLHELLIKLNIQKLDDPSENFEQRIKQKLMKRRLEFIDEKLESLNKIDFNDTFSTMKQLQNIGHQLKGTASIFEYHELAKIGSKLEEQVKNNDKKAALESYKTVMEILNREKEAKNT